MKKPKNPLTDEEVEQEIARLQKSELVKLGRSAENLKNARRQQLYNLRRLEKLGLELTRAGITKETLAEFILGGDE